MTVMELRQLVAQRKMEMMLKLVPNFRMSPGELNGAIKLISTCEYKDFEDFVQKYGDPITSINPVAVAFSTVAGWYEGLGILYYKRIADRQLIAEFFGYATVIDWEKMKPFVIGLRERTNPKVFEYFEHLAREMKKWVEKGTSVIA